MANTRIRAAGVLHMLTPRGVLAAGDGTHSDGGGLVLRVRNGSAMWVVRYTAPSGQRRDLSLGSAERPNLERAGQSLVWARDEAHLVRELLRRDIDPIEHRKAHRQAEVDRQAEQAQKDQAERAAEAQRWTLARATRDYHERVIEPTRTAKHSAQWIASLENHVPPDIWHAAIETIEPPQLLAALQAVKPHERARNLKGATLPETVQRLRQRLDAVWEDAIFHKRAATNPAAAVKRKMREASGRRERGAFRALPYKEAPAFMAALRSAEGVAARCLELAVLTAARTSEVLLAEWPEFNLDEGVWSVPAARMKGKEAHTVHLSPRAVDILKSMQGMDDRFVFPSTMAKGGGKPMSNMAMLVTLGRLGYRDRTTVHGLARASFSTWANETGAARPDVIEACLAHEESNRVRAAYNRSEFATERKVLLIAWSDYLARPPAKVIELQTARA